MALLALVLAATFLAGQVLDGWDDWDDCPGAIPSAQFDDFADVVYSAYDVPSTLEVAL